MKKDLIIILSLSILVLFTACSTAGTEPGSDAEAAIMKVIAADSTLGTQDFEDIENEDFGLYNLPVEDHGTMELFHRIVRDSNYVWAFGRTDMERVPEIIIEFEDDSSAQALISEHITGIFHVRQFERIWVSDDRWVRGDSVRFSQKAIDLNTVQRVQFRKRLDPADEEHWLPIAKTFLKGQSGSTLDIEGLEFNGETGAVVVSDFETVFYGRANPLVIPPMRNTHLDVLVSNDVAEEGEMVSSRMGIRSHMDGRRFRSHFIYLETRESGEKVYAMRLAPTRDPQFYAGFVEVMDFRTLFDHDHEEYSVAMVGLNFRHEGPRPGVDP